jgi:hypothetical protein
MREAGEPLKVTGHPRFQSLLRLTPVRYLYRRLLLMDARELFIPYDGAFPRPASRPSPISASRLSTSSTAAR